MEIDLLDHEAAADHPLEDDMAFDHIAAVGIGRLPYTGELVERLELRRGFRRSGRLFHSAFGHSVLLHPHRWQGMTGEEETPGRPHTTGEICKVR
jgi:hypothetical protein